MENLMENLIEHLIENLIEHLMENLMENLIEHLIENLIEHLMENLMENLIEHLIENLIEHLIKNLMENPMGNLMGNLMENPIENIWRSGLEAYPFNPQRYASTTPPPTFLSLFEPRTRPVNPIPHPWDPAPPAKLAAKEKAELSSRSSSWRREASAFGMGRVEQSEVEGGVGGAE